MRNETIWRWFRWPAVPRKPNREEIMDTPIFEQREEFLSAVERSISYGLIATTPRICAPPRLASEAARSGVAAICSSSWVGSRTGLCQLIASLCAEQIKEYLGCDAWMAYGWLSDIAKPGTSFWKMNPDDLCKGLARAWIGHAEFHAWVMLDSGEIIDPVVYPTLSENFKHFSHAAGHCNILSPDGRPYKVIPGLPLFQYHLLAITG